MSNYLRDRWDPQNYDPTREAALRREGVIDLDAEIGGVPSDLLLRTLERLGVLGRSQRAQKLDTFVYED